jgi:hypothetical protein
MILVLEKSVQRVLYIKNAVQRVASTHTKKNMMFASSPLNPIDIAQLSFGIG